MDHGLVKKLQAIFFQGVFYLTGPITCFREPYQRIVGLINLDPVSSLPLGGIHGGISLGQEYSRIRIATFDHDNSNTQPQMKVMFFKDKTVLRNCLANPLRHRSGLLRICAILQQKCKFITAKPGQ